MATVGFALSPVTWVALPLLWSRSVAETVAGPVQAAWMNRHLEPGVRATVLSMEGQLNAVGQIAGGPPLGMLGNRGSVRGALVASALVYAPVIPILGRLAPVPETPVLETETPRTERGGRSVNCPPLSGSFLVSVDYRPTFFFRSSRLSYWLVSTFRTLFTMAPGTPRFSS